jgi:hypothetical protein
MMAALNYLDEAKELWGISHTEGTKHDAQLAIGATLIAIAEELQKINERAELEAERGEIIPSSASASRLLVKESNMS